MIYLQLFLTFLKIGAVSFGGGYGMIPLMREEVLANGWLTEDTFMNFIAVSESTPGPIAVNMATFVGSSQGGILGSFLATLGVVLPAFIIILIVSAVLKNILKYAGVQAVLGGIRPAVVGLILATSITMIISTIFNVATFGDKMVIDWKGIVIFGILATLYFTLLKVKNKKLSPIIIILISAALGLLLYALPI